MQCAYFFDPIHEQHSKERLNAGKKENRINFRLRRFFKGTVLGGEYFDGLNTFQNYSTVDC